MKNNLITLFLALLFTGAAFSQEKAPTGHKKVYNSREKIDLTKESTFRIKDDDIDKFVGVWKWKQGNDIVTLDLKKVTKNLGTANNPMEIDVITGTYQYTSNETPGKTENRTVTGSSNGKPNMLFLTVYDPVKNTNTEFQLVLGTDKILRLESNKQGGERIRSVKSTLPSNIELKKDVAVN